MRRTTSILVICTALLTGGSALPAAAADVGPPSPAAVSHRAGVASQQHVRAPLRILIGRAVPRTVAGVVPLPVRPPGLGVLTDIRPRPASPGILGRTAPTGSATTLAGSTRAAVAAARASWGHPDDVRAVLWSSQTATAIEQQVDRALAQLLPSGTPWWVRLELRRASLTAVKSTFCAGLEAVVLRPDGQVSVDMGQVAQEVVRSSTNLRGVMGYPSNLRAWVTSMQGTVRNVSRSAWLTDDQGRRHQFDPTAYQGAGMLGRHALALRSVPRVLDASGRHAVRAAFVLHRLCYALPKP